MAHRDHLALTVLWVVLYIYVKDVNFLLLLLCLIIRLVSSIWPLRFVAVLNGLLCIGILAYGIYCLIDFSWKVKQLYNTRKQRVESVVCRHKKRNFERKEFGLLTLLPDKDQSTLACTLDVFFLP